ncbi:hypothetical protein GC197_14575 [bacterium]|nr:hypothetical protein [bacterium]
MPGRLLIAIFLLVGICSQARAADTGFNVKTGRDDSRIQIESEGEKTIFDITSEFGIDRATIQRKSKEWPKTILLRLHLNGLESLKISSGNVAVQLSLGTGNHVIRTVLVSEKRVAEVPKDSPYFAEVRIVGGNGKIPLKDGYFEVALPSKLLEENPDEIKLQWIDFYRN